LQACRGRTVRTGPLEREGKKSPKIEEENWEEETRSGGDSKRKKLESGPGIIALICPGTSPMQKE